MNGKSDHAIAHWRKAIELAPEYVEAYNDLGTELLRRGRTDEALAAWQKATEVNPSFAPAYFNLGNALAARGRTEGALAAWRRGLELASGQGNRELASAIQQRIAGFR